MSPHPLDNPIWSALTTRHASLAEGDAQARRYPPDFARFAALAAPDAACFDALARMLPEGEDAALVTPADVVATRQFDVTLRRDMLQMIWLNMGDASAHQGFSALGPDDVPEMRALVDKTKPGPFNARTHELGRFLGARVDGRLAAMAGERMHVEGFTEISAVCADPAFRGRGFARDLITAVAQGIVARGEVPFLHVFADNLAAITLYRKLGFEIRAPLRLTLLTRIAA
jgi:ribosomal protein S18 acetylase RimI-like enzyme